MRFVSRLGPTIALHKSIGVNAVIAAALVVQNEAKKNARGGFKSGKFVTTGWNLITHVVLPGRNPRAQIGSTLDHFAFWELGHHNTWTRKYERHEWLRPAMDDTKAQQNKAADIAARATAKRFGMSLRGLKRGVI